MQEKIWDLLIKEEEISWRTILYDLVKSEEMDPWNIDITLLTKKYIETIQNMETHDLRVSGKIVLAAAILLKLKSSHLIDNDFSKFDAMLAPEEDLEDLEDEMFELIEGRPREKHEYTLIPRNPQPRNRKVSINDLVQALQRALASKKRVLQKIKPEKYIMPKRGLDIMEAIEDVYHKIGYYSKKDEAKSVTFSRLLPPKAGKLEKAFTFMPLLQLENHQKIDMNQKEAFDEIHVSMASNSKSKK
jgi:segregation and condensation protein A